jgi:hypothetical protein
LTHQAQQAVLPPLSRIIPCSAPAAANASPISSMVIECEHVPDVVEVMRDGANLRIQEDRTGEGEKGELNLLEKQKTTPFSLSPVFP